MRSSALSLIDSSLSSKHCRTISLKTVKSVRSTQNRFTILLLLLLLSLPRDTEEPVTIINEIGTNELG